MSSPRCWYSIKYSEWYKEIIWIYKELYGYEMGAKFSSTKKKTNKQKTIYVVLNNNKQTDYLLSKLPKYP